MSRRRAAEKREVLPDAKFGDIVLSKFMNTLMERGKKSVAERVVYGALDEVESKLKQDPVPAFHEALENESLRSKSARAASVAPPTRCPSKSAPSSARLSPSAGSSRLRATVRATA